MHVSAKFRSVLMPNVLKRILFAVGQRELEGDRIHLWTDHIVIQFSTPLSRLYSVEIYILEFGLWSFTWLRLRKSQKNLGKRIDETIGW